MAVTNANPFTSMRSAIEKALEDSPDLAELGATIRSWDDARKRWLDNPAADRQTWLRVETTSISYEPFWSNAVTQTIHRLRVVCALPKQAGLKQEDIEQLAYAIMRALTPFTRDDFGETVVSGFQKLEYRAGAIGLTGSDQPDRQENIGDLMWSQVGDIEVTYHLSVAGMTTERSVP